ncbi:hypothetical protein ACLB2K_027532 [Fragaria x ananassa]
MDEISSSVIWLMDGDDLNGAWTKQVILMVDIIQEFGATPWEIMKSDKILMLEKRISSYNFGTNKLRYFPIDRIEFAGCVALYVSSIVSVLGENNKFKTKNYTSNVQLATTIFLYKNCRFYKSLMFLVVLQKNSSPYRYSLKVWAMLPKDASLRIKNVMEGLRAKFGGREIKIVGSIQVRPHLSLLFGKLAERKRAEEKVSILDESISSLSFSVTRFALYKID